MHISRALDYSFYSAHVMRSEILIAITISFQINVYQMLRMNACVNFFFVLHILHSLTKVYPGHMHDL